ncbi:SURF1 family cytochrome oxidase biogenesis protein [Planctomonas psychrotolerans]|uniref:SURF1 family cytochrome oxidase biogenesis protein n=1 Tax=Planctomonas psychrotolerans TaxID=2528712 RepID=UPI001238B75E|nr:SURF1 family protein [Planctomonas psychrotolerans]
MKGWRFVVNLRWAAYLAVTVLFAVACGLLSNWQFDRREQALAEIRKVTENWDREPVPLEQVLPTVDSFDDDQKWTPVELRGSYLTDEQVLARNRPFNGRPGFEVLTPLQLDDGSVFVVDRGWLPVGNEQDYPDDVPAPPVGEVDVVVRLKPGEPVLPGRLAPDGQIATVHLPKIAETLDAPLYSEAYGLLVSEDPAPDTRPLAALRPAEDEGSHLSYAFQWIVFGILGFLGLGYAIRNEYRIRNADEPEEQERARKRERKRAARAPDDAEIEDRILADR